MMSLYVICGSLPPNQKSWLRLWPRNSILQLKLIHFVFRFTVYLANLLANLIWPKKALLSADIGEVCIFKKITRVIFIDARISNFSKMLN